LGDAHDPKPTANTEIKIILFQLAERRTVSNDRQKSPNGKMANSGLIRAKVIPDTNRGSAKTKREYLTVVVDVLIEMVVIGGCFY